MKKSFSFFLLIFIFMLFFTACEKRQPLAYDLNIEVQGQGAIYPSGGKYQPNALISFVLEPQTGWHFSGWEGRDSTSVFQNEKQYQLAMTRDIFLVAIFAFNEETIYDLDLEIEGSGLVEPRGGSFKANTKLNFTIYPDVGWSFLKWSGPDGHDLILEGLSWTLVMNCNKKVKAVFSKEVNFKLDLEILGKGQVEEKLIANDYPAQSVVLLTARAVQGWYFSHWQGDLTGENSQVYLEMTDNKKITAVFKEQTNTLKINIEGQGYVEEKLLNGGKDYPNGSLVRLWAKADEGWVFNEWLGDVESREPIIQLEMEGDREITAVFTPLIFTLEITISGQGQVKERQISSLEPKDYPAHSIVRLTAQADRGWFFKEWQGDRRVSMTSIEVEMDDHKHITAVFVKEEDDVSSYLLELTINGEGTVNKKPDLIDYPKGTEVLLAAQAASGWLFKEWRGDLEGSQRQMTLLMDENKEIEAIFELDTRGKAKLFGSLKVNHTWPVHFGGKKDIRSSRVIGKIPILQNPNGSIKARELYAPGQLIVGFNSSLLQAQQIETLANLGYSPLDSISLLNAHLIELPEADMFIEMHEIARAEGVAYVEPNYSIHLCASDLNNIKEPNDEYYPLQWHYRQLRLPQAWQVTTGDKNVRVAVLDTGIAPDHPDLINRLDQDAAYNVVDDNEDAKDRYAHGTHCAGTIGAETNNGIGVAGVNWDCTIIPVKVYNDFGGGTYFNVAKGILYAAGLLEEKPLDNPAHILSMSIGGLKNDETMRGAVEKAHEAGLIMVAAAGNEAGPLIFPAALDEVIAVGAVDYNYPNTPQTTLYTCFGPELDVVAPGGDLRVDSDNDRNKDGVLSTNIDKKLELVYNYYQGTSMSCPHVAGVAALMLANGVPAREVKEVLAKTAIDLGDPGFDNYYGHGHVNAYWAVCNVKEIKILVGTRNGSQIDAVAEGKYDLKSESYELSGVPEGEYQVFAWIDVQQTGTIDLGDHFYASEKITFLEGENKTINIELNEITTR